MEAGKSKTQPEAEPCEVTLAVKDSPLLGSKDAPLTVVEFVDYRCHYCKQCCRQTFQDIKHIYIDSKQVRFYVVDFPIDNQPASLLAAAAGRCSGEQGNFWTLHEKLIAADERLDAYKITEIAKMAGLDIPSFQKCLNSDKYKDQIEEGVQEAASAGVMGTPTFIIGASTATGVKGELVTGALTFGAFQERITKFSK